MASDPIHQKLYEDLINNGEFDCGKNQIHVCLTKRHSQELRTRKDKRCCFILYGPGKNHDRELGAVHIRKDFWNDAAKMKEKGVKFHEDAYDLFHRVENFLKYRDSTRLYGKNRKGPDWRWYDVEDWKQFSRIVRRFNKM